MTSRAHYFDYSEYDLFGRRLNSESGWIPGLDLAWKRKLSTAIELSLGVGVSSGKVDYQGETQSGQAHVTETEEEQTRLFARLDLHWNEFVALFVSLQGHRWQRDILDTDDVLGLKEVFHWQEWSVGFSLAQQVDQDDSLYLEVGWLLVRDADLRVDLTRAGLGGTRLHPGNEEGARLRLGWQRWISSDVYVRSGYFYEAWSFARSESALTAGGSRSVLVTEPESRSRHQGLQIEFGLRFK